MNDNQERVTRLDRAIDHAVQQMMHVDPQPGLRHRVLRRLRDQPEKHGWRGAAALATAALVLVFATTLDRTSELPPASPGQAAVQPSAPSGEIPIAPEAQTANATLKESPAVPQADPADRPEPGDPARRLEPAPESIFGPRTDQVRGASATSPTEARRGTNTSTLPSGQTQKTAGSSAVQEPAPPAVPAKNVRIDVTITDEREGSTLTPKTVSVVTSDRTWGRSRSTGGDGVLIVDTQPHIQPDGRIRVSLTIEYRPLPTGTDKHPIPVVNKSLTALLDDGKVMNVSQTADPASNRTVRVDVKATLMK